uniref:S41 family peptidase n=1 Tax=Sphingomonas sp. TaxID=28214 RepID=UPI0025F60F9C|nr:S41 family peptidase [Sphingomonas sp.]
MRQTRSASLVGLVALLSACGGGGDSGSSSATPITVIPTPTPTSTATSGCSVLERQNWVGAQMLEWYLFLDLFPATLDPTKYSSVEEYLNALTANARAQSKDRYFTYLTSIKAEDAFYASGSSAGFGIRLSYDSAAGRLFVNEAFEDAPALTAGIDRGTEILAIGSTADNLQTVASLFAAGGSTAVSSALGTSTAGLVRVLRVTSGGVQRDVTVTKADYSIQPVSSRYGVKVLDDGGRKVGYVNLRTFITPADPQLRAAFDMFRAQGITQVIVDLRYNGGGLVSIAKLMGDLMGANRAGSVFSYTTFNSQKTARNETAYFTPQPQSIASIKLAFIGTGGTASASELVINAFTPYLHANSALIGSNTYGKPVGQIPLDLPACDDRLRVIAFRTENAAHVGDYYTGLATKVEASCQAGDDIFRPLGDPSEASVKGALDFLGGRTCTPISAAGTQSAQSLSSKRETLQAPRPDTSQREVPGLF